MSLLRAPRVYPLRHLQNAVSVQNTALRCFSTGVGQWREPHGTGSGSGGHLSFFGRPRLPTNKGIMFVPQQEAWVRLPEFPWKRNADRFLGR